MRVRPFVPALALVFACGASAQEPGARPKPTVPPELQKALAKATVHNQRVLAILGEEGRDLPAELKKNKALSRPLLYEFETVQLTGDAAHALAVQWKLPDALQERPTLAVLDAGGKVLANFAPAQFLSEGKLAGEQLLGLLQPLFAPPVDAEAKLAASLVEARKSGRAVFVRFDAPW